MNRDEIQKRLEDVFRRHLGVSANVTAGLVPVAISSGKLYEAHVLSRVVENLAIQEGYSLILVGATKLQLKTSGGPINRSYPRIELWRAGERVAEMWTDVEILAMSYCRLRMGRPLSKGDFHELDILIVDKGLVGYPRFDQIWLAIECKSTATYQKNLLREVLGIRRELSLLAGPQQTKFQRWPMTMVPANPASCLLAYSTDANVLDYAAPGAMFGIGFIHEPMP